MTESFCQQWFRRVWNEPEPGAVEELFAAEGEAFELAMSGRLEPHPGA